MLFVGVASVPRREDAIEDHEDHRSGAGAEGPPSDVFRAWLRPVSTDRSRFSDLVRPTASLEDGPLLGKSGEGFDGPEGFVVLVPGWLSVPSSTKEISRGLRGRRVEVLLFAL